jgi:hypothetical protein
MRRWTNPIDNYDNILMATFTLWQISTTELWVDTMHGAIAAVGVDQQPRAGHNPLLALFFIAFIVFGGKLLTALPAMLHFAHDMPVSSDVRGCSARRKQAQGGLCLAGCPHLHRSSC